MADLFGTTSSRRRRTVAMPDLEEMTQRSGNGILDLVKFAVEYNQATTRNKAIERTNKVNIMKEAATGITVQNSEDDIKAALDAITNMYKTDEALEPYGEAIGLSLKGTLHRRQGIDKVSRDLGTTRDQLKKVTDIVVTGENYAKAAKGAADILETLEKSYVDNVMYIDQQSGLGPRYNALVNEANDLFTVSSTADALDAIKYIEEKVDATSGALVKASGQGLQVGQPDVGIKYSGHFVGRGQIGKAAEQALEAKNWVLAQKYMTALMQDHQAKGMNLATGIRAIYPLIEDAKTSFERLYKEDEIEMHTSLVGMKELFGSVNLNEYISPEHIEVVFDMLSDDIKEIATEEEMLKGPGSYDTLDDYLEENQISLLKDLDSDALRNATSNLLKARAALSKVYEQSFGRPLRTKSAAAQSLEEILKGTWTIPGQE
tara:strand:- start:290 stop:1585 length:1296 start_codon:yes stop_codon:yes gene_type:complete